MFAVDLDYLLPTLAALGSGQSRNGLLPADLTLRPLLPQFRTGGQLNGHFFHLVGGWILIGPLRGCDDGRHLELGLADDGVVVSVALGVNGGVLGDLVARFSQHALRLGLVQLVFGVFGSSPEVAVAVDGVEVFGDRVLIVVAVLMRLLLRSVGTVDVLRRGGKDLCQPTGEERRRLSFKTIRRRL